MKVFCIRHHLTRNFVPQEWKAASWWEGEKGLNPRIFTERGAKSFVGQWLRGRVVLKLVRSGDFWGQDDYHVMEIEPMARTRDMLEIVPMTLVEQPK